jgi:manganese/zinc/iron transport system substrate-binding protein
MRKSVALLAISLMAIACNSGDAATRGAASRGKLRVVATTQMVADLARHIAGELADVSSLMGPGVDPHLFKASAGDLERLQSADLILYNGLHLEGKMGEVFRRLARRRPVVAVAESLPKGRLISAPGFSASHDPHVWFDVALWSRTLESVTDALAKRLPARKALLEKRAASYRKRLLILDNWVSKQMASIPPAQRVLVTAHDAFGYFGRRYKIEVVGLQGISTASKAGIKDVKRVVDVIVKRKIPAIFVESSVPPRTIEAVRQACQARGHDVALGGELFSDSMGASGSPAGSYEGMVRHNVTTLTTALGKAAR